MSKGIPRKQTQEKKENLVEKVDDGPGFVASTEELDEEMQKAIKEIMTKKSKPVKITISSKTKRRTAKQRNQQMKKDILYICEECNLIFNIQAITQALRNEVKRLGGK